CLVTVVPMPELAKSRYQSLTVSPEWFIAMNPGHPGCGSGLEDGDDALAAGGADGDQPTPTGAGLVQLLGQAGDDPAAGRGERVTRCQRRALHVELRPVDRAERNVQAQLVLAERRVLPRLQRGQHGRGEGLVDLVEVEVLQ